MNQIAWTGGSVVIVAWYEQGEPQGIYCWSQAAGTTGWTQELVAAGTGYGPPAVLWTGSYVAIAAVNSTDGNIYFWWKAPDVTTWTQEIVTTGGGYFDYPLAAPSIALAGPFVFIAATNADGNLYSWWRVVSTPGWNQETVATGGSYVQTSIAWAGGSAWPDGSVVIAANSDDGISYWWRQGGTPTWNHERVVSGARWWGNLAIGWTGSSVIIVASSDRQGDRLAYWWQAAGTKTWHKETVATEGLWEVSSAWTGSSVVIAADDGDGEGGNLRYWWQAADSNQWHSEIVATGAWTLASIAWTGSSVVITAQGGGGRFYWWQAAGARTWNQEQVA